MPNSYQDAPRFLNAELGQKVLGSMCGVSISGPASAPATVLAQSPGLAASTLCPSTETMLEPGKHSHTSFLLLWQIVLAIRALLGCFGC